MARNANKNYKLRYIAMLTYNEHEALSCFHKLNILYKNKIFSNKRFVCHLLINVKLYPIFSLNIHKI